AQGPSVADESSRREFRKSVRLVHPPRTEHLTEAVSVKHCCRVYGTVVLDNILLIGTGARGRSDPVLGDAACFGVRKVEPVPCRSALNRPKRHTPSRFTSSTTASRRRSGTSSRRNWSARCSSVLSRSLGFATVPTLMRCTASPARRSRTIGPCTRPASKRTRSSFSARRSLEEGEHGAPAGGSRLERYSGALPPLRTGSPGVRRPLDGTARCARLGRRRAPSRT